MQRRVTTTMTLCLGFAAMHAHADDKHHSEVSKVLGSELLYIGTWGNSFGAWASNAATPVGTTQSVATAQRASVPQSTNDEPQGIYVARLDENTGRLSPIGLGLELQRADYLVTHPQLPVIYSVAESSAGKAANSDVYSIGLDPVSGRLHVINKADAGGNDATALTLDAASQTLFSANHGSGDVSALPLRPDGSVGPVASKQKDYGSGPTPHQRGPVAHDVVVDPTHKYALVADFGADRVFVYHFDSISRALTPAEPPFEPLPAGAGPRHLVFHPNGRFVFLITELTAKVRSYRWNREQGRLELVQEVDPYPASTSAERSASEVKVSRDGRFAYVSLRGDQNSIVVYAVNQEDGTLKQIQRVAARGKSPWSFGFDPTGHWLVVANEASNSVVVFKVNSETGKLTSTGESLSIPKPTSVTFYPN